MRRRRSSGQVLAVPPAFVGFRFPPEAILLAVRWYLRCSDRLDGLRRIGLLRHALERCDQDQLPAYLEATSPMNRSLYGRHGFEEIGVIQAGASPPLWPMLRNP